MANTFDIGSVDGLNLYYILRRAVDGLIYKGGVWETLTPANWSSYAIAMSKVQVAANYGAEYTGTLPAVTAGVYHAYVFVRSGGSPATTDWPWYAKIESIVFNGQTQVLRLPDGWN